MRPTTYFLCKNIDNIVYYKINRPSFYKYYSLFFGETFHGTEKQIDKAFTSAKEKLKHIHKHVNYVNLCT